MHASWKKNYDKPRQLIKKQMHDFADKRPFSQSWDFLISQLVKNLPAIQETLVRFLGREDPLEEGQVTHSSILGLPFGSAGKESTCNVGDLGLIPGWGRPPGEGKDYPLQYFGLENSMNCILHGIPKSRT